MNELLHRAGRCLVAGLLLAATVAQAQACDPSRSCCASAPGGQTCGGADAGAVFPGSPVALGVGNPIHLATGNKYQREDDLPALPGVLGLEIVRHYNSVASAPTSPTGVFGRGWKLSYETELARRGAAAIDVVQADGSIIAFHRSARSDEPDVWRSADAGQGVLVGRRTPQGEEFRWRWGAAAGAGAGRELLFDAAGRLLQIAAPTGEFVTLQHDPKGWLVQVTDPQGRRLHLNYLDAAEVRADLAGRQRFRGVHSIDSPVGRYTYDYNDRGAQTPAAVQAGLASLGLDPTVLLANLVRVGLPTRYDSDRSAHAFANRGVSSSSISRLYHYEDPAHPTLLTGLSVSGEGSDGQATLLRLATWAYDRQGRANLSVKGEPARLARSASGQALEPRRLAPGTGLEQVTLQWPRAGEVVLTNALGQETHYRIARVGDQYRLLEARGPGCASCGPSDMRYRYDVLGRLVEHTRLGPDGQPRVAEARTLDALGRLTEVRRITYEDGKARRPKWILRHVYAPGDENPAPIMSFTPSVVPGQLHQLRVTYNGKGQRTRTDESGYAPADPDSLPSAVPTPIARTTTYGYQTINGRSLLTEIDGPLPNGPSAAPSDSDIIRLEYDKTGDRLTAVVQPGGARSTIRYDSAGRLEAVDDANGGVTLYTFSPVGQLVSYERNRSGRSLGGMRVRYDAAGRATEQIELLPGLAGPRRERPSSAQGYDVAHRLRWQADRLGILREADYDAEGHLVRSRVTGGGIRQEERYRFDAHGRLSAVTDSTGATRRLMHLPDGRGGSVIDPLGRETRWRREVERDGSALHVTAAVNTYLPRTMTYRADEFGRLAEVEAEGNDAQESSGPQEAARIDTDDFGREVAIFDAARGTVRRQYDAADRVTRVRDATGTVTELERDTRGRVVRRTVTSGSEAGQAETTRYVYRGDQLTDIVDPLQTEHYDYTAEGAVASRTVTLHPRGGRDITSRTRYRYDAEGLLSGQSLPDGSDLDFERNGQGQIVAVYRSDTAWTPWGWGRATLARELTRDLVGLRHARYGNGVAGDWQRSPEGILARVAYTRAGSPGASSPSSDGAAGLAGTHKASSSPGAFGLPPDPRAFWDGRLLYDLQGNVLIQGQFAEGPGVQPELAGYGYDPLDQLAWASLRPLSTAGRAPPSQGASGAAVWRYRVDAFGNRLLAQEGQAATAASPGKSSIYPEPVGASRPHDDAGRLRRDSHRAYTWDAQGRLTAIQPPVLTSGERVRPIARYAYNQRGERVSKTASGNTTFYLYTERRQRAAEIDAQGNVKRMYVWLGDALIAVLDPSDRSPPREPTEEFWGRAFNVLRQLWASRPTLYYVHANPLGAPVAMTDERGTTLWTSAYAPYGRRLSSTSERGPVRLDLRLAGQWEDGESGLYYNDHRYYDPDQGHYLTPDPFGVAAGFGAYTYVHNNPLRYVDPLGLVLFAFDGTDNTDDFEELARDSENGLSNVVRFRNLYLDNSRYVTGVGKRHRDSIYGDIVAPPLDSAFNFSGPERIERMIRYLNDEADLATDSLPMAIDIVGFSRGAAEARDFANQIISRTNNGQYYYTSSAGASSGSHRCQKLDFRFMGLWDTVLSTNLSRTYELGVSEEFSYVAQAVALNEFRGKSLRLPIGRSGAFPLESIRRNEEEEPVSKGKTRIERGFIGAHADVGGGFGEDDNQLSSVALNWMVNQATVAGLSMENLPQNIIERPTLHDKSDNLGGYAEDRKVKFGDGTTTTQREMRFTSGMTYGDTGQFVQPSTGSDYDRRRSIAGTIDLDGYVAWLSLNGYEIDIRVIEP